MKKVVQRRISSLIRAIVPGARKKKLRHPMLSVNMVDRIREVFDPDWYGVHYPHVIRANHDPFKHFIWHGLQEGLAPNAFFLSSWYLDRYADVSAAGLPPIIHYLKHGAEEGRDPHPDFDAAWYVARHPDAEPNPLLYHMRKGIRHGWPTCPPFIIEDYLPAGGAAPTPPEHLAVDIIVPVYKGLDETRRCLFSVLADSERLAGRIIVIDDCSPEPELSRWLDRLAAEGAIHLLRNASNLGFVRSVNRGMEEAGSHDVVLLNSDTQVPRGWLRRLAAQAWAGERVGTITPFSNNATICSYPSGQGGPLPAGFTLEQLDQAFAHANAGRFVTLPTGIGFCMYIRRDCLDEVGLFDVEAFGHGYGEENEFCMRARALKWEHRLACDTYVFHEGEVSFGRNSPLRDNARAVLYKRFPEYPRLVSRHAQADPAASTRFAASAMLLRQSKLPVILLITHGLGGGTERHVQDLVTTLKGKAECLILRPNEWGCDLSFPGLPGLSSLRFATRRLDELVAYLRSCGVRRLHIHHQLGFGGLLHDLVRKLGLPFDLTIHDYYPVCPQINLISSLSGTYCGEPNAEACNACIAANPVHGATDIISWRLHLRWIFDEAERILCPSRDVMLRLQRMGIEGHMMVVPHQPVTDWRWPDTTEPLLVGQPLRIAILGTLVAHKGMAAVHNTALAAMGLPFEFVLIGASEPAMELPEGCAYQETGSYKESELQALIRQHAPHVIWFPAMCPETYSYTLTIAIETGLPIIASNLGAFPERLAQHPKSLLVSPSESAVTWIFAFRQIREVMLTHAPAPRPLPRPTVETFYPEKYLDPLKG
ncbi:MAG: glycosyltransferase [Xanthobacter sp.]